MKIKRSVDFLRWLSDLRDERAQIRIGARLDRLAQGNMGVAKGIGSGVLELKIDYGPGYRVYCKRYGEELVILLWGGDKSTQSKDIERAKLLAERWKIGDEDGA